MCVPYHDTHDILLLRSNINKCRKRMIGHGQIPRRLGPITHLFHRTPSLPKSILLRSSQGRWVYLDGQKNKVFTKHSLLLCYLFGPVGFLSHLFTRGVTSVVKPGIRDIMQVRCLVLLLSSPVCSSGFRIRSSVGEIRNRSSGLVTKHSLFTSVPPYDVSFHELHNHNFACETSRLALNSNLRKRRRKHLLHSHHLLSHHAAKS